MLQLHTFGKKLVCLSVRYGAMRHLSKRAIQRSIFCESFLHSHQQNLKLSCTHFALPLLRAAKTPEWVAFELESFFFSFFHIQHYVYGKKRTRIHLMPFSLCLHLMVFHNFLLCFFCIFIWRKFLCMCACICGPHSWTHPFSNHECAQNTLHYVNFTEA